MAQVGRASRQSWSRYSANMHQGGLPTGIAIMPQGTCKVKERNFFLTNSEKLQGQEIN